MVSESSRFQHTLIMISRRESIILYQWEFQTWVKRDLMEKTHQAKPKPPYWLLRLTLQCVEEGSLAHLIRNNSRNLALLFIHEFVPRDPPVRHFVLWSANVVDDLDRWETEMELNWEKEGKEGSAYRAALFYFLSFFANLQCAPLLRYTSTRSFRVNGQFYSGHKCPNNDLAFWILL